VIALDAGVMAHALNRYGPGHTRASAVVESLVHGDQYWALPWPAVHRFLRLVTHPHRVARPLAAADAWGFVTLLLGSPGARPIGPGARHSEALTEVLSLLPAGIGPVPGLELAAVLREHGVSEVLSTDRALRAFPFLSVRDPLKGEPWTPGSGPARRYRRLTPRGSSR
jgi:hypothetical protein